MVKTLHWKNSKTVKGSKGNKLNISMPTVWFADGRVEFIVIWYAKRKNEKERQDDRWENIDGTWWFRSPDSKFTTHSTYVEILRFFCSLGRVLLFFDDRAPSHDLEAADLFLKTVGATRLRIPANATDKVQPADRPQTNQKLKQLVSMEIHKREVIDTLVGEFKAHPRNLSCKARKKISEVLKAVRDEFNSDEANRLGIAKAFEETLTNEPHSELKDFLESTPVLPVSPQPLDPVVCPFGCNRRWTKDTLVSYKKHHKICWFQREELMDPLLGKPNEDNLNGRRQDHLYCTATMTVNNVESAIEVRVEKDRCVQLGSEAKTLPAQWWKCRPQENYRVDIELAVCLVNSSELAQQELFPFSRQREVPNSSQQRLFRTRLSKVNSSQQSELPNSSQQSEL